MNKHKKKTYCPNFYGKYIMVNGRQRLVFPKCHCAYCKAKRKQDSQPDKLILHSHAGSLHI